MKEVNGKQLESKAGSAEVTEKEALSKPPRLSELRQEIDKVDEALVKLLVRRFAAVSEIAELKEESGLAIYDENREREILSVVSEQLKGSSVECEILEVFSAMLVSSKKAQEKHLGRG